MKIGAIQKFSFIDYPGKICAIVFTQGCNFRCPYCHNPELVLPECYSSCISEKEVLLFLERRRGKLEAVTVSGGEPTLQPDLVYFIERVKEFGYAVKLDTNGTRPGVVRDLITRKLIDYIAMDVKAPLDKYPSVVCAPVCIEDVELSIRTILQSGIEYEFRTTVAKPLLNKDDFRKIAELTGGNRCFFQKFVPNKPIDHSILRRAQFTDSEYSEMIDDLKKVHPGVFMR
jgi:pyruvate formate lyase activating enzyme